MTTPRRDLNRLCDLARLELDPAELSALADECETILKHFETIRQLDSAGESAGGVLKGAPPTREDVVKAEPLRPTPQEMAPEWRDGHFLLPRLPAMDAEAPDIEP